MLNFHYLQSSPPEHQDNNRSLYQQEIMLECAAVNFSNVPRPVTPSVGMVAILLDALISL